MRTVSLEPSPGRLKARQTLFGSLVTGTVLLIGWRAFLIAQSNGWSALKTAILVLFVVLLVPIALSFWTAVLGFFVQCRGGAELALTRPLEDPPSGAGLARTAIVMPVYNETPARVFAGLEAMYSSLESTGLLEHFDFFVLSDTNDPDIWVQEELAFAHLREKFGNTSHLKYRNRPENVERKTGNIADFCATWGSDYEYMIVLDADSVMTGASMVNLVRLMERHPRVGLIQAPPLPVYRRTLFGRLHQFAMHAYSPMFIAGLNYWQGGSANYWGHNAIVRVRPFIEHCRLPVLPGKAPLGGSILSHDVVEAAFLRRAGWLVYLASELRGSYEELPSSLLNYAARDRRWCQGNLQHARLLLTPGLHIVNRIHLLMGLMSYLAAPLWLLLLALTTAEGIIEQLAVHSYFPPRRALFPDWPISVERQSIILFAIMIAFLLIPKLLSFLTLCPSRERLAGFGGRMRFAGSVLAEVLGSTLLAPNLALLQTRFVVGILMGRNVSWESQNRGEEGTQMNEAVRKHWTATFLAVGWAVLLALTAPKLLWWFSPVMVGLLLAVPLSVLSSRTSLGQWAGRRGIFMIPDEHSPPEVLQHLHKTLENPQSSLWPQPHDGLSYVLENPSALELHLSLLAPSHAGPNPLEEHYLKGLELKALHHDLRSLSGKEKRHLLLNAESLQRLQRAWTASSSSFAFVRETAK